MTAQTTILVEQPEEIEGVEQDLGDLGEYPIDSVLIRTEPRTIFDVVRQMEKGQYILAPDFQREIVWNIDQQSKLIESTLMRIPLPVFYLAEQEDGRVDDDGLQRLTTFNRFFHNQFALRNLTGPNAEFNGKHFKDLAPKFQTRIEDTPLILYLIDSKVPERARLDIFDRVNRGVPLSRQQMRNCLYVGEATRWLRQQAQSEWFLTATGRSLNSKTMRDRETINRFCGFYLLGIEGYERCRDDMDQFFAETLSHMNQLSKSALDDLAARFQNSMEHNHRVFGAHAFRKHISQSQQRNVINIALFDVFSVLLADRDSIWIMAHKERIQELFYKLMENEAFVRAISQATHNLNNVRARFAIARQAFEELEHANKLTLEYFKCFERLQLPLAPLSLLSGLNAAGKSSALQALSLLHQSAVENEWNRSLILNGRLIALGSAGDVIDKIAGRYAFSIGLESATFSCLWTLHSDDRVRDLAVAIRNIIWREPELWVAEEFSIEPESQQRIYHLLPEELVNRSAHTHELITTLTRIAYISSERIGPRETYPATTPDQQTNVGPRGEYTPWFLYHFADQQPLDGLLIQDAPPTLQRQTEAWMDRFFPGAGLVVRPVEGANLMTMGIRTSTATSYHRPQNVGFGITHVLPILISCLGAGRNDVVLLENPASHLHPAGQSAMGRFLAMAAAAGAQIILESHSDHVLNGVRRAVKDGVIAPEQVAIHFFAARTEDGERAQVIQRRGPADP